MLQDVKNISKIYADNTGPATMKYCYIFNEIIISKYFHSRNIRYDKDAEMNTKVGVAKGLILGTTLWMEKHNLTLHWFVLCNMAIRPSRSDQMMI